MKVNALRRRKLGRRFHGRSLSKKGSICVSERARVLACECECERASVCVCVCVRVRACV